MAFKFNEGYKLPVEIEDKTFNMHITGTTHQDITALGHALKGIKPDEDGMLEAEDKILDFLEIILGEEAADEVQAMIPEEGERAIHLIALAQYVISEINRGGAGKDEIIEGPGAGAGAAARNRAARRQAEREERRASKKKTGPQLVE